MVMDEAAPVPARGVLRVESPGSVASDDELVAAALADRAAFARIYERDRLPVFRFLRGRTASEDDALDLVAVTFERALVSLGTYRGSGGGLLAWMLRIARNAAVDESRRRGRAKPGSAVGREWSERHDRDPGLGLEDAIVLRALVADLPEPQRDAVLLRYAAGLSVREISEVIGKREEATRKLLQRALHRLREELDGRG